MYPRNAASPERIAVGAVVQISDGAVQTAGVSIAVHPQGGASAAGGGTTFYDNGIVEYTPTQAETNYTSFLVVAYKTGCIPASQTIVTSASATAGHAGVDWSQVANPTTAVNLSGTNIKTDQTVASVSGAVGSVTGAVGSVTGSVGSVTGAVGSVTGSVGSISGVTFPTNFGDLDITATAGTVTLKAATHAGAVIPTVSTLTGHTAQTGDSYARIGAPAGASVSADVAAVKTDTGNLVTRITATLFSGITSLAEWLGSMAGKQTPDTTAQTEMRASGAGSGTFDATTDSYEAIRDQGDSAWITGGGGAAPTALEVADAVWDEATSGHAVAGSAGKALTDTLADTSNLQGNQGELGDCNRIQHPCSRRCVDSRHPHLDWVRFGVLDGCWHYRRGIDCCKCVEMERADWGDATAASQSTMTTHLTDIKGGTFSGATDSLEAIRDRGDAAWTTGSAGTGLSPLATGTAQGGTSSTVQLAAGEAVTTDLYKGSRVLLVSGTGAGQSRIVTAYNGTTKTCTVSPALVVTPDATTVYEIQAADSQIQMMDHTSLAGVTFPSNFGDMAITASTGLVTVGTNNDKAGYSISGTKTTLDALNDIAATAIVSGGAINTTSGAVDNVTLVATTTTNTDMVAAAPTAASVADAVWDETLTAHVTADSAAVQLKDVLADTGNLQGNQGNWVTATGFATAGDAMTLTAAYDAAKTAAAATDIVSNGASYYCWRRGECRDRCDQPARQRGHECQSVHHHHPFD